MDHAIRALVAAVLANDFAARNAAALLTRLGTHLVAWASCGPISAIDDHCRTLRVKRLDFHPRYSQESEVPRRRISQEQRE